VVAGGDDHEEHERRVERSKRAHERAATVAEQAGADDQRVADMHAGDSGIGVVERADETAIEVDVAVRDGVGDTDAGQPRRCRRVDEEADEGQPAREQERGANERERRGATLVQPEQHACGDREVKRQVCDAEQAGETRESVDSALHVCFEKQVQ
jgi:hypothetical protein